MGRAAWWAAVDCSLAVRAGGRTDWCRRGCCSNFQEAASRAWSAVAVADTWLAVAVLVLCGGCADRLRCGVAQLVMVLCVPSCGYGGCVEAWGPCFLCTGGLESNLARPPALLCMLGDYVTGAG